MVYIVYTYNYVPESGMGRRRGNVTLIVFFFSQDLQGSNANPLTRPCVPTKYTPMCPYSSRVH